MTLLNYSGRGKMSKSLTPEKEAAVYDFITGGITYGQAAEKIGCTRQGVITFMYPVIKSWIAQGEVDMSKVKDRIADKL